MKYRRFLGILKENGFEWDRTKGSHSHYVGYVGGQRRIVTVSGSGSDDIMPPDPWFDDPPVEAAEERFPSLIAPPGGAGINAVEA
jgi:predicted RNA binding protein YcfA (HicA-like mRNA interferase family)